MSAKEFKIALGAAVLQSGDEDLDEVRRCLAKTLSLRQDAAGAELLAGRIAVYMLCLHLLLEPCKGN